MFFTVEDALAPVAFTDLLRMLPDSCFDRLDSARVMLLAYICEEARIEDLGRALRVPVGLATAVGRVGYRIPSTCDRCPPGHEGRDARVDLLLDGPGAYAMEVRFGEPPDETVAQWQERSQDETPRRELAHWLHLTGARTDTPVGHLSRTLVQQTAAAAWAAGSAHKLPHVTNLLFDDGFLADWCTAAEAARRTLSRAGGIAFEVIHVPMLRGADYANVASTLAVRGPSALREALLQRREIWRFGSPDLKLRRP